MGREASSGKDYQQVNVDDRLRVQIIRIMTEEQKRTTWVTFGGTSHNLRPGYLQS